MGTLHLITGDIIENCIDMDAIVNAQNKYMQMGSGVCGAIYNAAGIELLNYCQNNYKEYMIDGEVRITPGFNLKCNIMHVLAPKAFEQQNPLNSLLDCYENLLDSIKNNHYKKVILPSLGAGIHGYKHDQIAKPLMILLSKFCIDNNIDLYFINLNTLYTNFYLNEHISVRGINLKNDLLYLNIDEIKEYLENTGLANFNSKVLYDNFVKGKQIEDMNITEKIIALQYTIEHFKITKEQLEPLILSF